MAEIGLKRDFRITPKRRTDQQAGIKEVNI